MKFAVDAQLPRRLALWLAGRGQDAIHTLDLPGGNATSDSELTRFADADGRVVVTKDADFVNSFLLRGSPRKLLLISAGNLGNDALLALFATHWVLVESFLLAGSFVELSDRAVILHQ